MQVGGELKNNRAAELQSSLVRSTRGWLTLLMEGGQDGRLLTNKGSLMLAFFHAFIVGEVSVPYNREDVERRLRRIGVPLR